jgi:hypothetical protein
MAAANSASQSIASYHESPIPWPPVSRAGPQSIPRATAPAGLADDYAAASAAREALWPRAVVFLGLGLNIVWVGVLLWGFVELVVG